MEIYILQGVVQEFMVSLERRLNDGLMFWRVGEGTVGRTLPQATDTGHHVAQRQDQRLELNRLLAEVAQWGGQRSGFPERF